MEPTDPPAPVPPRNDNPAHDTFVASLLDPAFDKAHPDWPEARERYLDTRAVADLARLPTVPEQWPTLWRLRPLSAVARTAIYGNVSVANQRLTAVRLALVSRIDGPRAYGDGAVSGCQEKTFPKVKGAAVPQVEDAAVDEQVREFGGLWLDEMGELVIHRTNAPRKVFLPFSRPLPSQLL